MTARAILPHRRHRASRAPRTRVLATIQGTRERAITVTAGVLLLAALALLIAHTGQSTVTQTVWPTQPALVQSTTTVRCPTGHPGCWRATIRAAAGTGTITSAAHRPARGDTIRVSIDGERFAYAGRGTGMGLTDILLWGLLAAMVAFGLIAARIVAAMVAIALVVMFMAAPALIAGSDVVPVSVALTILTTTLVALAAHGRDVPVLARTVLAVTPAGLVATLAPGIVASIDAPGVPAPALAGVGLTPAQIVVLLATVLLTSGVLATVVPTWLAQEPSTDLSRRRAWRQLGQTARPHLTLAAGAWLAASLPVLLLASARNVDSTAAMSSGLATTAIVPFALLLLAGTLTVLATRVLTRRAPLPPEPVERAGEGSSR